MIQDFFLISTTHWLLWIGITLLVLEVAILFSTPELHQNAEH
tara:strand:+ start:1796 stop:1921 length:126 start_codon:yes stop_codon:yes gene_type:complete